MSIHRNGLAVEIGDKVRARRVHNGLSEEDVSRVLGMSVSDYQSAEVGEAHFTAEDLYNLCSVLRVKVSWFFEGISKPADER